MDVHISDNTPPSPEQHLPTPSPPRERSPSPEESLTDAEEWEWLSVGERIEYRHTTVEEWAEGVVLSIEPHQEWNEAQQQFLHTA